LWSAGAGLIFGPNRTQPSWGSNLQIKKCAKWLFRTSTLTARLARSTPKERKQPNNATTQIIIIYDDVKDNWKKVLMPAHAVKQYAGTAIHQCEGIATTQNERLGAELRRKESLPHIRDLSRADKEETVLKHPRELLGIRCKGRQSERASDTSTQNSPCGLPQDLID
jgi:hypothetical protein